jgi:hypothetical protein
MIALIFGLVCSLLAVLVLGYALLRRWAQKQADVLIWTVRQQELRKNAPAEDKKIWVGNKSMHMD